MYRYNIIHWVFWLICSETPPPVGQGNNSTAATFSHIYHVIFRAFELEFSLECGRSPCRYHWEKSAHTNKGKLYKPQSNPESPQSVQPDRKLSICISIGLYWHGSAESTTQLGYVGQKQTTKKTQRVLDVYLTEWFQMWSKEIAAIIDYLTVQQYLDNHFGVSIRLKLVRRPASKHLFVRKLLCKFSIIQVISYPRSDLCV